MIIVSIISHNNAAEIISTLKPHEWSRESATIKPFILSNTHEPELATYCQKHDIEHIQNNNQCGFGANNNKVFRVASEKSNLTKNDMFFCINPDITTTPNCLIQLKDTMLTNQISIAAPNLINSEGILDDNIRSFPKLNSMIKRLVLKSKDTQVDKSFLTENCSVEWASGAFLCFNAYTYQKLNGYDERYYMYYEDVDICRRAHKKGINITFLPQITAIHKGQRQSRRVFSRAFIWHCRSALRFILTSELTR